MLIKGAENITIKYKIPQITIGLTIIAIGTSLPELIINIIATIKTEPDIIIGNIVGSNISNTLLILGIGAAITTITITKKTYKEDLIYSLGSTYLLIALIFANILIFQNQIISRITGAILLIALIIYMKKVFAKEIKNKKNNIKKINQKKINLNKTITQLTIGMLALFLGGEIIIRTAITISSTLGITTMFLSTSIIALGTSLPELATIIISLQKNKNDFAIGNIIGSNIFNILLILGISALIKPIIITSFALLNFLLVAASTLIIMLFLIIQKKNEKKYYLTKKHAIIMITLYLIYLIMAYLN